MIANVAEVPADLPEVERHASRRRLTRDQLAWHAGVAGPLLLLRVRVYRKQTRRQTRSSGDAGRVRVSV